MIDPDMVDTEEEEVVDLVMVEVHPEDDLREGARLVEIDHQEGIAGAEAQKRVEEMITRR